MRPSWRIRAGLAAGAVLVIGAAVALVLVSRVLPVRVGAPPAARSVPEAAFREEQIRFVSGGNTLAGVLTLPTTPGPHPAVVFLNGSGAGDRTGGGLWPPLWRRFAGRGFASLSWDRPGVGESSGDFEAQTFDDRTDEALAAVALLRARPDVRPDAVGLWGFSQGGIVAPLAASRSDGVAFLVEVSGCQTVAWQQDLYRVEAELRADGFPESDVAEATAFARLRMDLLRGDGSFETLDEAQRKVQDRPWFEYVHLCDRKRFGSGKLMVGFDPGPCWEKVRCPVLAIFGEKDASCPVERSVAVVRAGLEHAGNRDVTIRVFPRAAHAITVSDTGGPREARQRAEQVGRGAEPNFAPGYPEAMSDWLAERFGPRR